MKLGCSRLNQEVKVNRLIINRVLGWTTRTETFHNSDSGYGALDEDNEDKHEEEHTFCSHRSDDHISDEPREFWSNNNSQSSNNLFNNCWS